MKISLGGSAWLRESTAAWKAQQTRAAFQERQAWNIQAAVEIPLSAPIQRLYLREQLDRDFFVNGILHGAAMRFYHDWRLSRGSSEIARERQASFNAAHWALGDRYRLTIFAVVVERTPLQTAGEAIGYTNRSAAVAGALERLNVGLRRLAVWYGLLAP